ncbi:MAG TPA: hypothetical protein VFB43_18000 [Terracidiphilus sp.]|nr:hypothetical protein [Terracidiphilus sp.]
MIVRDATFEDSSTISEIHAAMGLDYRLPDLNSPLFFVRKVAERDGIVRGACFLRICAECYLWLAPEQTAPDKMRTMEALQPEILRAAWAKGLDDIEARIPETLERRFHKRLTQLGWTANRNGWHPWSRETYA